MIQSAMLCNIIPSCCRLLGGMRFSDSVLRIALYVHFQFQFQYTFCLISLFYLLPCFSMWTPRMNYYCHLLDELVALSMLLHFFQCCLKKNLFTF